MTPRVRPLRERFSEKYRIDDSTECWIWTGNTGKYGYGRIGGLGMGHARLAHRVSYELHVGPIPEGLTLDHLCRNRACVNPEHLEPVTLTENKRRGESPSAQNARKTHCAHGHAYTLANTYVTPEGYRRCRACWRTSEPVATCQAPGCTAPLPPGSRADKRACSPACALRRWRYAKAATA